MRQQINLFQSVLIDKQEPLQAKQAKTLFVLFVVVLGLLSLVGYLQLQNSTRQVDILQQQQEALTEQVAALDQQYPERHKSALLEEEVRRSQKNLDGQNKLLRYFSQRDVENNGSILRVMEGLARHRTQGVWLRSIVLSGGGENIALKGSALRPEQVPQYLQSIGENNILGGKVFSKLSVTQLDERSGQVNFSLESLAEEQP